MAYPAQRPITAEEEDALRLRKSRSLGMQPESPAATVLAQPEAPPVVQEEPVQPVVPVAKGWTVQRPGMSSFAPGSSGISPDVDSGTVIGMRGDEPAQIGPLPVQQQQPQVTQTAPVATPPRKAIPAGVDPALWDQYQGMLDEERQAYNKDRGVISKTAGALAGGVVSGLETGMRAARVMAPEGTPEDPGIVNRALSSGIKSLKTYQEESPFLQEDPNAGIVGKSVYGGLRSFSQSLVSGIPGAVVGGVVTGGNPLGAVAGFALNAGTLFGLGQYDDVMERGVEHHVSQGMSKEDAIKKVQPEAIWQGVVEGGFEFVSDLLMGKLMGADKILTAPAKDAVKVAIKELTNTSFKQLGKRLGAVVTSEVGTEMAQAGLEAESDYRLGIGNQKFWDAAIDAIGPSFVASLLFGGLGHANVKLAQGRVLRALEDPNADPQARTQAALLVGRTLHDIDPVLANAWNRAASGAILEGQPISTDENLRESLAQKIANLESVKNPSETQKANLEQYKSELLALPEPERGFTMREPGDVYSPYAPEFTEEVQGRAGRALTATSFDAIPGDTVEQKVETLNKRIENRTGFAQGIEQQLKKTKSEKRKAMLSSTLENVNGQVAEMRGTLTALQQTQYPEGRSYTAAAPETTGFRGPSMETLTRQPLSREEAVVTSHVSPVAQEAVAAGEQRIQEVLNDRQGEGRIPSGVGVGEELGRSVQERTGSETPASIGGILQAQEGMEGQVTSVQGEPNAQEIKVQETETQKTDEAAAGQEGKVGRSALGLHEFAKRNLPGLEQALRQSRLSLTNSEALASSPHYDGSFPIPRQGGILAARNSNLYKTSAPYREQVESTISSIAETIVGDSKRRSILIKALPRTDPYFSVVKETSDTGKVRATYGVDVVRAWNMEAKAKYPNAYYLGDIAVREGLQNSLDAVLEALEKKQIRRGDIEIETNGVRGYTLTDNGVGMSDVDIADKFLALHGTGKSVVGRFGGFGVAKAVILGPSDDASWTLHTRDNSFTHEMAQANEFVQQTAPRQGTQITVTTDSAIVSERAKSYVETTDVPKNVKVTYNGEPVVNPFAKRKHVTENFVINPETTMEVRYYPKSPAGYNRRTIIRLVDPKTNSRLTQAIDQVWNDSFNGVIIVDITTTATPNDNAYPLTGSRMELKYNAREPIQKTIDKYSVNKETAGRAGQKSVRQKVVDRPEWADTARKIQTDEDYQKLMEVISELNNKYGKSLITPWTQMDVETDVGHKGYKGGNVFHAKHVRAYEAAARIMSDMAHAPVYEFYLLNSKLIDGGRIASQYGGGNLGLNHTAIDKDALKSPLAYANYIKGLLDHELTHYHAGPHDETFSTFRERTQRDTIDALPDILRLAEAVLGKEDAALTRTKVLTRVVKAKVVTEPVTLGPATVVELRNVVPLRQLKLFEQEMQGGIDVQPELYYPTALGSEAETRQLRLFGRSVEGGTVAGVGSTGAEGPGGSRKQSDSASAEEGGARRLGSSGIVSNKRQEPTLVRGGGPSTEEIVAAIRALPATSKQIYTRLTELGQQLYVAGKDNFDSWRAKMKTALGDAWDKVKKYIRQVWGERAKWIGNERGAIGGPSLAGGNSPGTIFSITNPLSMDKMLDFVQSKIQSEPNNSAIQVMFGTSHDIGVLESVFKIPEWLGKTNKAVKEFVTRQRMRIKDKAKWDHDLTQMSQSAHELDPKHKDAYDKLAYELDGKKIFDGPMFTTVGKRIVLKSAGGNTTEQVEIPIMAVNPDYYKAIQDYIAKKNLPEEVVTAYMDSRRTFDQMFIATYDKLADLRDIDPDLIKQFRTEMGRIPQYWPHNRYGNYYIQAIDPAAPDGEGVRYREHFTSPHERYSKLWYSKNIDRIVKEMTAEDPSTDWAGLKWEVNPIKNLPESVFDHPIPLDAMQQLINGATDKMPEEIRQWVRSRMSEEVSNQFKSRGHGAHMIQRKNIPGYDKSDALRVLHDQITGFSGWITKTAAAHDYAHMLSKLDAKNAGREYTYLTTYVQNMLENQTKVDRVVDAAKSVMFLNWLGGNIKNFALNLTQNVVMGTPRLGMDVGIARANKALFKAMQDIRLSVTEEGVAENPRLTEQERTFLAEMYAEGWGRGILVDELRGRIGSGPGRIMNKVTRVMGWPMEMSERYNRMSLGLAAFRMAQAGKITNQKTLVNLGAKAGAGFDYHGAKDFAETVVNDAHFVYGKGNRPQFFRGGTGGKLIGTTYTFRTFSHNLISAWRWMLSQGDSEGKKALAASLLAIISLGGLGAVPLYQTLASLIRQMFGDDILGNSLRKQIPAPMRDLVMYGAPSALGVNLGGSLGMELPVLDKAQINKGIKGQVGNAIGEILGVPYAVLEQYTDAIDAFRKGNTSRALETAAPAFIKNVMAAHRMSTEGQTSVSGKPIALPGEKEARKLGTGEAIAKAIGFQPLSSTKAWEMHKTMAEIKSYRDEAQEEWANKYVQAKRANDNRTMDSIREEARKWNREAVERDRRELRVDLQAAVRSRLKPGKPMKQMRGLGRELRENYGI